MGIVHFNKKILLTQSANASFGYSIVGAPIN